MIERFGVIGLGSMGTRRVRDLLAEGRSVVGFDIRPDREADARTRFGIETAGSYQALLRAGVEAMVISTPPDVHVMYYEECFAARRPFFSEASIFTPRAAWFADRESEAGMKGFPSATWRYHPLVAALREEVHQMGPGRVNTVSHQYAGYLPHWHPWEPYQSFYAGQPRTCAAREMVPFEAEILLWIFGPVRAVCAIQDRRSEWVTDITDTYLLLLEFESGVRGTMAVELHQVDPYRYVRVAGRNRSYTLDLRQHTLREAGLGEMGAASAPKVRTVDGFNFEDVYRAEMRGFLDGLDRRRPYEKTWADDRHLSCILAASEESWRRRCWVSIEEAERLHDGLTV